MELMHPIVKLKIRVKGDEETVNGVLSGLSGISGYGLRESGEEGVLLAEIEYEHGKDIRDTAAMAFAQAKCLVVGLSFSGRCLPGTDGIGRGGISSGGDRGRIGFGGPL